jgi:hypothetical protein
MARPAKQDNRTLSQKVMLRQTALAYLRGATPVICETHGGRGDVWAAVYSHVAEGVVFEIDPDKAEVLAAQRPTWAVYQADAVLALGAGAGSHLVFNLLDVDPYGSAWDALEAFFAATRRTFAARMVVVVHDGLRLKASSGSAWATERLAPYAAKYGNHAVWREYPDRICRELMAAVTGPAGYAVRVWESYATGHEQKMVHMLAVLERDADGRP